MAKDDSIIRVLESHRKKHGGVPQKWYAGITAFPKDRQEGHGNPRSWIHRKATSEQVARDTEKELLRLKYTGDKGGGRAPTYVYIFKKKQ